MACWDDERVDPDRTITRIIEGVFHHPAQRDLGQDGAIDGRRLMFGVVEQWWQSQDRREQNGLQRQLSRDGVMNGENHKEGVHDSGHGCGKPLQMQKNAPGGSAAGGLAAAGIMGELSSALGGGSGSGGFGGTGYGGNSGSDEFGKFAAEAAGGGALGGLVGALAGGVGGGLLSGAFGGGETETSSSQRYTSDGGYQQEYTEVAHGGSQYGQAQYSETQYSGGRQETDYQRYQQSGDQGVGFQQHTETRPTLGGGYEESVQRTYERPDGVETETWREGRTSEGRHYEAEHHRQRRGSNGSDDSDGSEKKKKHHKSKHDSDSEDEYGDRPKRYSGGGAGYGGGYGAGEYREPQREQYQERRNEYEEPRREYGGGQYGESRGGYDAPRQEYGGGGYEAPRQEYGGGGYEAPRQEYGGGGYEAPRQEYSRPAGGYGEPDIPAAFEGNEAGWGQERRDDEYERRDDYGGDYEERRY
jgi:hypothetical protein